MQIQSSQTQKGNSLRKTRYMTNRTLRSARLRFLHTSPFYETGQRAQIRFTMPYNRPDIPKSPPSRVGMIIYTPCMCPAYVVEWSNHLGAMCSRA